ncbi:MAG: SDR family oxidoreductase [Bacteroidales bacterium]|nr:SDR family oxidoreductase [Bacteroidales bacterium]
MTGKTVLITGANSGIGKATAIALAEMGAEIIMVSRNSERGEDAAEEVRQSTGSELIRVFQCDLASLEQVRDLSDKIHQHFEKIDVLINNAGLIQRPYTTTVENFEYQFGVNYLSHFLLTQLLIDMLRKSDSARIINLSSIAHKFGKIHFDDLQLKNSYTAFKAYAQSKLANVIFTYALCNRLADDNITSNAVHPGMVGTRFGLSRTEQYKPWPFSAYSKIAIKPSKGAETVVFLASSQKVEGKCGGYYVRKKAVCSSRKSYDPDAALALWNMSLKMCKLGQSLI